MQKIDCRAEVQKPSYLTGEEIVIRFIFDKIVDNYDAITNVSIDIHRVEVGRNQFTFGFGAKPQLKENALEISQKLDPSLPIGLHILNSAILCWGNELGAITQRRIAFPPVFFVIRTIFENPISYFELASKVTEAEKVRHSFANHEIYTPAANQNGATQRRFRVLIFGVGCLLHSQQQLQGFLIAPLDQGMSHRRLHDIVNNVISQLNLPHLKFSEEMELRFAQGSPTFLISYINVVAINETDALDSCRAHAALAFELLGLDRGQKPTEFACYAVDLATGQSWHLYQQPWYRGNLASDFNPVSTANMMERYITKLQSEPFLRLIVKTYADATSEQDLGFALLRFWSVLELVADKYVNRDIELQNPDGSSIQDKNGRPLTTRSAKGRVYKFILDGGHYTEFISFVEDDKSRQLIIGGGPEHPGYTDETDLLSLWDMVTAAYAIRNSIAHEGHFDFDLHEPESDDERLAARLIQQGHADPRRFVRGHAHSTVMRELNK